MMKKLVIASALLLAGLEAPWQAEAADAMRPLAIGDYLSLQSVGGPRISPDGKWVAYTVSGANLEEDSRETRVWMVPTSGGERPFP